MYSKDYALVSVATKSNTWTINILYVYLKYRVSLSSDHRLHSVPRNWLKCRDFGSLGGGVELRGGSVFRLHFLFTHQQSHDVDGLFLLFTAHGCREAQRATLHVDPSAIDDVHAEVLNVHDVLGSEHLAGADGIQHARFILGEVSFQHLGGFLGLFGIAGGAVLLHAGGLELFHHVFPRGFVGGFERVETEVDRLGDFFLRKLAADVGITLDDCEGVSFRKCCGVTGVRASTYWDGRKQKHGRTRLHQSR